MKKLLIMITCCVSLLSITAVVAMGQTRLGLGFKGGLNIASVSHENIDDMESRIVAGFGGYLTINIKEYFAIQPELLYMQKGAYVEDIPFGVPDPGSPYPIIGTSDIETKINYIEIPILAKLSVPSHGDFSPFLQAGPALAIKINAERQIDWSLDESSGTTTEDADNEIKAADIGLVVGGGIDYAIGIGKFSLEVRYTYGLTSTDKNEDGEEVDVKSRVFSIMAGYSFPIGGH